MAEKWYPGKHLGLKKSKAGSSGATESSSNSMAPAADTTSAPRVVFDDNSAEVSKRTNQEPPSNNPEDRSDSARDDSRMTAVASSSITAMPVTNDAPPPSSPPTLAPQESDKWYPGKLLGVKASSKKNGASSASGSSSATCSSTTSGQSSNLDVTDKDDEKWYPGKNMAAAAAAMPRPLLALRRRVVAKRALKQPSSAGVAAVGSSGVLGGLDQSGSAVATLRVTLLQGRKLEGIRRPFVELCVDGFEHRSSTKRGSNPDWRVKKAGKTDQETPKSSEQSTVDQDDEDEQDNIDSVGTGRVDLGDSNHGKDGGGGGGSGRGESFVFNVWDLKASSNVTVLLFDDYDVRRDKCTGRVVVPLSSLLAQSSIHAPTNASPHWSLATSAISILAGGSINASTDSDSTSSGGGTSGNSNSNSTLRSGRLNFLEAMTSSAGATLPPQRQWYQILPPAPPHATKEATAAAARASAAASAAAAADSSSSSVLIGGNGHEDGATVEFLAQSRYESGVIGVPASAMARPRAPLGYLELEIELTMSMPLLHAYVRAPPHLLPAANQQGPASTGPEAGNAASSPSKEGKFSATTATSAAQGKAAKSNGDGSGDGKAPVDDAVSAAESLDPRKLRMNIARLKRALKNRTPLLNDSIWRIGVLLPLTARACFWMPSREFPLWIFFLVVLHGYLAREASTPMVAARAAAHAAANNTGAASRASSNHTSTSTPVGGSSSGSVGVGSGSASVAAVSVSGLPPWMLMYDDEVGPPTVPKGALSKIRLLKSTVARLQVTVGKAALFLEKSANLWNWSDPAATFLATCALGALCLIASLVLTLVPFNVLIFVIVAFKLLTYKPAEDTDASTTAATAGDAGTAAGSNNRSSSGTSARARSNSNEAGNASDNDDENDEVGIGDQLWASQHGPGHDSSNGTGNSRRAQSTAAAKAAIKSACQAVLARVPDENELVHRAIANLQPLRDAPP